MKVSLGLKNYFKERPELFQDSFKIAYELNKRGHEVNFINSTDFNEDFLCDKIYYPKIGINDGQYNIENISQEVHKIPENDLMIIRMLDENSEGSIDQKNIEYLKNIQTNGYTPSIINPPDSLLWNLKKKIVDLENVPIPDTYIVNSASDLENLLNKEKELVVKSDLSFFGLGVDIMKLDNYNKNEEVYQKYFKNPEEYIFQTVNESNIEKRIAMLGDDLFYARKLERVKPWEKESYGGKITPCGTIHGECFTPTKEEMDIVYSIFNQTGMKIGSVDFIGEEVNEINGGGIGTSTYDKNGNPHSLTNTFVDFIENNYS